MPACCTQQEQEEIMMSRVSDPGLLTLGVAADRLGVQLYRLSRLFQRGALPTVRVGRYRVIRESDLPRVKAACLAAGYLK
jgi:hypothetical protein